MQRTLAQESIQEEVAEIMQALGITLTRLNNLVNMVQGDLDKPLSAIPLQTLEMANKEMSEAWESLKYFLDPEV